MGKAAARQRWAEKMDRDPSKWPVAPDVRIYMVDCDVPGCGSRMPLWAIPFHVRRHQRLADAATKE